jgi:CRISPR-associated protein Cmr1
MFNISRFKDIEKRKYECEVVTPLFLGGADPHKTELRVPPIKAAMRFWWRAQFENDNIEEMAKREAEIFGSTEKKSVISVSLEVSSLTPVLKDLPTGKMVPVKGKPYPTSIIHYLAYGLHKREAKKNVYIKEYVEPKSLFRVSVCFPKNVEHDVINAFKALLTCGGIGARSRNGFGSLHCNELNDFMIKKEGPLKSFTAFSKSAILFNRFNKHDKWEEALSEIGMVYRDARLNLEDRHKFAKRGLIAMPIESQNEKNIPQPIREGRHAKPYFLHVNKRPDGKYQGHILFLPYLYKAGPNDVSNKLKDYASVCQQMNDEIAKGMEGKK